jgi:hypothetical protein
MRPYEGHTPGCADIAVRRIPSAEILRERSDSRWTVYDVLPTFFKRDERIQHYYMHLGLQQYPSSLCLFADARSQLHEEYVPNWAADEWIGTRQELLVVIRLFGLIFTSQ